MPRKRQHTPRQGLDTEVVREIERQTQKQQEIDNKRTKQRLIFWSLIIFGTAIAIGVGIVLSDLAEW
jgi:1,4-dihydroxy-2-naphthoate octaprenyltransferase